MVTNLPGLMVFAFQGCMVVGVVGGNGGVSTRNPHLTI